jgi:hypothetical protein
MQSTDMAMVLAANSQAAGPIKCTAKSRPRTLEQLACKTCSGCSFPPAPAKILSLWEAAGDAASRYDLRKGRRCRAGGKPDSLCCPPGADWARRDIDTRSARKGQNLEVETVA